MSLVIPWAFGLAATMLALLQVLAVAPRVAAATPVEGTGPTRPGPVEWGERPDGRYYTLVDPEGRVVTYTAVILGPGDTYIDARNRRWEVVGADGDRLRVQPRGVEPMPDAQAILRESQTTSPAGTLTPGAHGPIGIYFTHSDESYVPTSGSPTKPRGDIYQVGEALADTLRREGYPVEVSHNNHNPHDGQAYYRSRRTAMQLLRDRPLTLIDVHRDAVPPQVYNTTVEGQPMVKVRFVVGRQNQNMQANLAYAKRLKALADARLPGIVEGIFLAQGNYNQDLGPRTILLEFGAHTNSLDRAVAAARTFAGIIPAAAGAAPGSGGPAGRQIGQGAWRGAGILVLTAAIAVGIYLAINNARLRPLASRAGEQLRAAGEALKSDARQVATGAAVEEIRRRGLPDADKGPQQPGEPGPKEPPPSRPPQSR